MVNKFTKANFKDGDRIRCIDAHAHSKKLTLGKTYIACFTSNYATGVRKDDTGKETSGFYCWRFIKVNVEVNKNVKIL